MSDPTFGLSITRVDTEPRPAIAYDLSVIGLIGTAELADTDRFPLDTPVFVYSDDTTLAADLGATGTLLDAIDGIHDQLGEFQTAAKVVVVRVTEGVDDDATITNIVGASGAGTGLWAFISAGPILGIVPRLLIAPGYTAQGLASNAVIAELPGVCAKLLAHAIVDGPATDQTDAIAWREGMISSRLIPVETAVKVGQAQTVKPASPRIAGIAVRRDHEFQGRPFHSWANQPISGIVGPSRTMGFSLTDGATEGQVLLSNNLGVILRGEAGVESAISSGGYIFVGTDNASDEALWQFYNVTRGRDYIHLMLLRTLRTYLGKFNLTASTVEAVEDTVKFALRDLQAKGDLLGYQVSFARDQNSPEQLRLGKFHISFEAEEPPVLRYLGISSARYRPALDALLDDLLAQVDTVITA